MLADYFVSNCYCGCDCRFSLAAAAKNAEMISQLWLEKQRIKQEILCTNKTKRRIENVKIKVYF